MHSRLTNVLLRFNLDNKFQRGGGTESYVHEQTLENQSRQLPESALSSRSPQSLYAHILPSPRRCPVCCEILDPLRIVRLEGGEYRSEYELAFLEMAWDLGYLTPLCFHLHLIKPTKAEWTLREKQSWTM